MSKTQQGNQHLSKAKLSATAKLYGRAQKSHSEQQLAYLRKVVRRLRIALPQASQAPSASLSTGLNQNDVHGQIRLPVKILAHLNLAIRGIVPSDLADSELSKGLLSHLNTRYFDAKGHVRLIGGAFSTTFTRPLTITKADWPGSLGDLLKHVDSCLRDRGAAKKSRPSERFKELAGNRLAVGWAQEALAGELTQVFTPEAIGQFLAGEVLPEGTDCPSAQILDPACGAGHLVIPAAERWLALQELDRETVVAALNSLLAEKVIGLDIEQNLLQLCGFSLYLLAHDTLAQFFSSADAAAESEIGSKIEVDLSMPQLFLIEGTGGSLQLGAGSEVGSMVDLTGVRRATSELPAKYAQIIMNPPYLSTRTMDSATALFLKKHFADCAGDLYTAFIELAIRLLAPGGRLATIVQQSFLSIQRYLNFRLRLIEHCHIASCLTLGHGSFSSRPGEKVNSSLLTLERKENLAERETRTLIYGQIDMKFLPRRQNLNSVDETEALNIVRLISGNPFAFDCPKQLAALFAEHLPLNQSEGITITNGLFTCNNKHFVRLEEDIAPEDKAKYVVYDKGGGQKWYHKTNHRLRWQNDGVEIREYRKARGQSYMLPGEEFYFKAGVTYSYIGTTGFKARLLSENAVFDIASSALFSQKTDLLYLLGFLNSSLVIYLLGVLNPTVNFQVGDLRRLPFKLPSPELESNVAALVAQAVALSRYLEESGLLESNSEFGLIAEQEAAIQNKIDNCISDHYAISENNRALIEANNWVTNSRYSLL